MHTKLIHKEAQPPLIIKKINNPGIEYIFIANGAVIMSKYSE